MYDIMDIESNDRVIEIELTDNTAFLSYRRGEDLEYECKK